MSTVQISETNPIPLIATVSSSGGVYSVALSMTAASGFDEIDDTFGNVPPTVTVNVTSTTVPSGYHLAASGDGSWTSNGSSSISGVFTAGTTLAGPYSFTILVTDGTTILAQHDPRLIIRKMGSR
jgi:hypothetical protein